MLRSPRVALPLLAAVAAAVTPAAASARSIVVAGGDSAAQLVDVSSGRIEARLDVGGQTRGAAVAPDGSRGYVSGANRVVAIDLATNQVVAQTMTPRRLLALAISPDGTKLYATRSGAVDVIDTATMTTARSIAVGRSSPDAIAISADGGRAVVLLDAKRVGVLDLTAGRLVRRVPLAGATGVTFAPSGPLARVVTVGDPTPPKRTKGQKARKDTAARLVTLDAREARAGLHARDLLAPQEVHDARDRAA